MPRLDTGMPLGDLLSGCGWGYMGILSGLHTSIEHPCNSRGKMSAAGNATQPGPGTSWSRFNGGVRESVPALSYTTFKPREGEPSLPNKP